MVGVMVTPSATLNNNNGESKGRVLPIPHESLPFLCGALSGVAGAVVGQPFDTIKVRMQTGFQMPCGVIPSGARQCLSLTMRHEGATGLFKGLGPQLACQIVSSGLLFGAQDSILHTLARQTGRGKDDIVLISTAGAISGGLLSLVTCPMELIKCGLQSTPAAGEDAAARRPAARPVSNLRMAMNVAQKVVATKGVQGLYTGLTLTALRCSVGNFGFFGVHELCWRLDRQASGGKGGGGAVKNMTFGAVAGCAYWIACYPMDLLKSRSQCLAVQGGGRVPLPWRNPTRSPAPTRFVLNASLVKQVARMYTGLGITLVRGLPVASVGWLVYGTCRDLLAA